MDQLVCFHVILARSSGYRTAMDAAATNAVATDAAATNDVGAGDSWTDDCVTPKATPLTTIKLKTDPPFDSAPLTATKLMAGFPLS